MQKWLCRLAKGKIPSRSLGARCVVVDEIIYLYGGASEELYGLDPMKLEWFEVATPITGIRPWHRCDCCLWEIETRLIMFGGCSEHMPKARLQFGAQCGFANNEIYEFKFNDTRDGFWEKLVLSGKRPEPRSGAATATLDNHRGILHGGYNARYLDDMFIIDLKEKTWIPVCFDQKISPRSHHSLCKITIRGKAGLYLIGGSRDDDGTTFIIDFEDKKIFPLEVDKRLSTVTKHTVISINYPDSTAKVYIFGGSNKRALNQILTEVNLEQSNEDFTRICFAISPATKLEDYCFDLIPKSCHETNLESDTTKEHESQLLNKSESEVDLGQKRNTLTSEELEKTFSRENEEQKIQLEECKKEIDLLRRHREVLESELLEDRQSLNTLRRSLETAEAEISTLTRRCQSLDSSLTESRQSMNELIGTLTIDPTSLQLTGEKLGSGAYADVCVGLWRGTPVAIKKFYDLITTPRSIAAYQREVIVASHFHHPNIMKVCGAIMTEGVPFQMVAELLEGSVDEVIDAAQISKSYLTTYEQISVAMDIVSAIAYLHQLNPTPYIHGDIRSTNALVTRDMKVKVGDMGAAHLLASSQSAGPLSPRYLAPERMPPPQGVGARSSLESDIYSLGVTLIEIFTGRTPVPGERQMQLGAVITSGEALFDACEKSVERDPAKRVSAQELFDVLASQLHACIKGGCEPIKRLVKSKFEGQRHIVVLSQTIY